MLPVYKQFRNPEGINPDNFKPSAEDMLLQTVDIETTWLKLNGPGHGVIKIMFNSAELEIFPAHKY